MAGRFAKVMSCQYTAAVKSDEPHLIPIMSDDLKVWHFLVCNLGDPHYGGEYLLRLDAPDEFPRKPPSFSCLTPNGTYGLGGRICISIGEFHANDTAGATGAYGWRPALGMIGFAREAVNGLTAIGGLGSGIRLLDEPPDAKRAHAAKSAEWNRSHHPKLMERVDEYAAEHPDCAAVLGRRAVAAIRLAGTLDFAAADPAVVAACLADGFGKAHWAVLAPWWRPGASAAVVDLAVMALQIEEGPGRAAMVATLAAELVRAAGGTPAELPAPAEEAAPEPEPEPEPAPEPEIEPEPALGPEPGPEPAPEPGPARPPPGADWLVGITASDIDAFLDLC